MLDAVLAWLHFIAIISFSACLIAESVFYARRLSVSTLERLARVDIGYGILTIAVIATGVAHAIASPKGGSYYLHDAIFWTKMGLFVIVGLLSIAPTVHFIRLGRDAAATGTIEIPDRTYRTMRVLLTSEVALLLFIPLCASLMARGYGYF